MKTGAHSDVTIHLARLTRTDSGEVGVYLRLVEL